MGAENNGREHLCKKKKIRFVTMLRCKVEKVTIEETKKKKNVHGKVHLSEPLLRKEFFLNDSLRVSNRFLAFEFGY